MQGLSRRNVLMLTGAGFLGVRLYGSSSDFWNKKPPAQWTPEEADKLASKSPWAKDVKVTAEAPRGQYGGGYPGGGGGYPGGGGGYPGGGPYGGPRIGIGGRSGGMGRGRMPRQTVNYDATVRWESAQPIREALKSKLPEEFANHYVISVSGVPFPGSRRQSTDQDSDTRTSDLTMDELKQSTILQPKGKELVQAGLVKHDLSNGSVLLFGFSKEMLPLAPADKEVEFQSKIGNVLVKAKFELKEMIYHGQLAV